MMFSVLKTFHFMPCFAVFFSAENINAENVSLFAVFCCIFQRWKHQFFLLGLQAWLNCKVCLQVHISMQNVCPHQSLIWEWKFNQSFLLLINQNPSNKNISSKEVADKILVNFRVTFCIWYHWQIEWEEINYWTTLA